MNRSMLTKLTNHLFLRFSSTLPIPLPEHLVSDLVFLENLFNTFVKMIDGKREESGGKCIRKWPQKVRRNFWPKPSFSSKPCAFTVILMDAPSPIQRKYTTVTMQNKTVSLSLAVVWESPKPPRRSQLLRTTAM